ncbi:MAG TPA: sulfotransferase [Steroidobacteraceae bacterium]|nr:sulfotransferase [Steroidobacteraceae bacterium]
MKLPKPFFRLPVRFDVERLRAEVEALPATAWSRDPKEHEGNTAARLITVGGGDNDDINGEMGPTPALAACPYIQQALASFDTVWSRSRLMRLAPSAEVPPHGDMNRHWFHRVRVHIPVITRPEVRFHCGGESVHMAAGEAWIFDNWREHRVINASPEARIHLVADTAGTSAFWRLVTRSQSEAFDRSHPDARLVAFDAAASPQLLLERFNTAPVMAPAEVEQLAFDLLGDLAPADPRPESRAAVDQFIGAVIDFCHDWRALWSLVGEAPAGRGRFEQLIDTTRQRVAQLPHVKVASTGYSALAVLRARLFAHLLAGAGGSHWEATEFNADSAAAATEASADSPTAASREPPRRRLSQAAGRPVAPDEPPFIERPLIILSAPRAGSTLLFETLAQAGGVYTIGGESHALIESIAALRPGRGAVTSNRLTRAEATWDIVTELRRRFSARVLDRDGAAPAGGARIRLLEKTPKNALRIPFFLEIFPDAQFIFLRREPRANLSSMMQAWRANGWVTYRNLSGWPGPWSLLLPPGYERLRDRPLEEIVAFQWKVANETILEDLANLPRERWTSLSYEDFIANPRAEVAKLLEFAGLAMDERLEAYLAKPLPLSRHTQTRPDPDKWKQNAAAIERVLPQLEAVVRRLAT